MDQKANYSKIKDILDMYADCDLEQKRGATFHYRIYMTPAFLDADIEVLELSVRSYNGLKRVGVNTIGQLLGVGRTSKDIIRCTPACGRKSVMEIMESLFAYQYSLLPADKREEYINLTFRMNGIVAG